MRRTLLFAALVALGLLAPAGLRAAAATPDVRALWVVRTTMTSPAAISAMVAQAKAAGINTLLVQVRGRGDAYYRSRIEPRARALQAQRPDFDPLAAVLREAHQAGLKVHAWVNVNLVGDVNDLPTDNRHVVRRHPDWLMLPAELAGADPHAKSFLPKLAAWTRSQSALVEGLYTSPLSDDAADHVVDVVTDLVSRYGVDGIHFDYIRFPGPNFDYSRQALHAFRDAQAPKTSKAARRELDRAQKTRPAAWAERFPEAWADFRRARLTALLRRLRTSVLAKRPQALVSAAVVPDPMTALTGRLQDWPGWIGDGLLDVVCPMAYTDDLATFRRQIQRVRVLAGPREVWAGIGAYRISDDQAVRHIDAARELGAQGVVLFSYDSLATPPRGPEALHRIGHQAFGGQ